MGSSGINASGMLSEAPGPVNFTQMVTLFAEKMAGGADDDDTILKSFDAFEINGKIDAEMFKHSLMTWGDKFSGQECDEAFAEFMISDGQIDAAHLKGLSSLFTPGSCSLISRIEVQHHDVLILPHYDGLHSL